MSANLEYRGRERQRNKESRLQASEAQREKCDIDLEREIQIKGDIIFGRTTWKFCSDGEKMRNASGDKYDVKMSGSEKKSEREHVQHFLHKTCS